MKKIIAIITLFAFFTCYPAFAFAPLAIPAWYWGSSIALHVAGAAAGLYYAMKPSSTSSVTSSGDIKRPSSVVWVDLNSTPPALNDKNITAKMSHSTAQSLANKKSDNVNFDYPNLQGAYYTNNPEELDFNTPANKTVNTKSGIKTISNFVTSFYTNNYTPYSQNYTCNASMCVMTGGLDSWGPGKIAQRVFYFKTITEPVPKRAITSTEAPSVLSANGSSGGDVKSAYQAEFDKMFQDPDYVPVFSDDTTGLPFSPPTSVATPNQVALYNANGSANEAKEAASASSQNAASSAGSAASTAAAAYQASGGDPSTGIGGDPALYQKFKDAEASAAAAQAAADKLKADLATADVEELVATLTPGVPDSDLSGAGALGSVIIDRLKNLGSNISGKAPFSYLTGVQDAISSLYAPAQAPSFDLPLGPFASEPLHISMSWADPLAALTRFFSWLMFTLGAIWSFKGYWHRS